MRLLVSLLAMGLLGVSAVDCGDAGKFAASKISTDSTTAKKAQTAITFSIGHGVRGLKGDEDDDEPESSSTGSEPNGDNDGDNDNDVKDNANKGYYDGDDTVISGFGRRAGSGLERALTSLVRRYYEAAIAGNGGAACALILPSFAEAIPEDFGRVPGPLYLRGAKTCPAVMSRIFKHEDARLATPLVVTGVRVRADEAYVLLGSKTEPASYVFLKRHGSAWGVLSLLSSPLP
jgi:hypothetical protein